MADIRKFWPILVYAFAIWANTDVAVPISLGMHGPSAKLAAGITITASVELIYSFWFWGWIVKQVPEIEALRERRRGKVRSGILVSMFHGVTDWVLDGIIRGYQKATHPENGTKRHLDRWGVAAVWVLGVNPIPGLPTRGPCCIFLGFYRRRKEFLHLLVANLVHIFVVFRGWGWLLGFFKH